MDIYKFSQNHVVDFAAEELKKYIMMMEPRKNAPEIFVGADKGEGLKIGLMRDFGLESYAKGNTYLDDSIYIDADEHGGIIAGSNERSILLGVYEYLRKNGCIWLFPGVDGERIPVKHLGKVKCYITASKRFRGQCNEGSEAQENMLETIDFLPKIGLNTFMLEFDIPQAYYRLWYEHRGNPYQPNQAVLNETVLQWKRQCEAEITKRGLLFHDMGHGWCADAFGIDTTGGWDDRTKEKINIGDNVKKYIAEIDGKRELFENAAINTNICMSNEKARSKVVNRIADYARSHSHVDFLHVWLADSYNNHCECAECSKKDTADWYVILLNEIDRELQRRKISVKIVFIVYCDLLWAPVYEKIKNTERFAMLFAPITRTYDESYAQPVKIGSVSKYQRNNVTLPKGMGENLAYLDLWKKKFDGDTIAYEYHFHWVHYRDPGYMSVAKCVYDDIAALDKCGICGIIEDQTQRGFFPNGFPQYVYGRKLFDKNADFNELAEEYFSAAYGEDWKSVYNFLKKVSEAFEFKYMIQNKWNLTEDEIEILCGKMKKIQLDAEEFEKKCSDNFTGVLRCISVSWQLINLHCTFVKKYAECVYFKAKKEDGEAYKKWFDMVKYMYKKEPEFQRYFDVNLFQYTTSNMFKPDKEVRVTLN